MKTVLVVDDEEVIRENMSYLLSKDFRVLTASSTREALESAKLNAPDAILADLQMPDEDGLELCRRIRADKALKNIPILMISGFPDTLRRTECFIWGADDFIAKPFSTSELIARLTSKLRWNRQEIDNSIGSKVLTCGNLVLNEDRFEVLINNNRIELTNFEFKLLKYFISSVGYVSTRDIILEKVWTGSNVTLRTVDTHICTLRKKISNFDHEIEALSGRGYVLRKK